MKLAFLDMDGTLFPGVVGKRYLRDLMEDGVCRPEPVHACLAAIDRYAAAPSSHSDALAEAYRQYALALHGVSLEQARRTATRSWQACRDQLFPFVGDLIALLKAHDYRTCLISGTGDLPVQEAVRDLGLNCGRGTVTEIRDGHFTDRLTCVPALPGGKAAVVHELMAAEGFDPHEAMAIGNSDNDAEIFRQVGTAICFEPDEELSKLAADRDWLKADRSTILRVCSQQLGRVPR